MNKQIIAAITIIIILGLAVAGLGWFYVIQKKTPASQENIIQVKAPVPSISAPVIEERLMTTAEKTKYGIAQDVQAKIKTTTTPYSQDEQTIKIEIFK